MSTAMKENVATLLKLRMTAVSASLNLSRQDKDFDELFTSSKADGAYLDRIICARDAYGGRGLYATCDIAPHDIVAMLPRHLRIGQSQACLRMELPSSTPDLSALSLFILSYMRSDITEVTAEMTSQSAWTSYARTLPKISEFKNAATMSSTELSDMSATLGKDYYDAAIQVQKAVCCCNEYISSQLSSADPEPLHADSALRWAISMVLSRSHAFGSTKNRWLTPIFDLANHCPESTGGGSLISDDMGNLLLKAGNRPIACGDEVTFDYQCLDSAKMAATYGFSI